MHFFFNIKLNIKPIMQTKTYNLVLDTWLNDNDYTDGRGLWDEVVKFNSPYEISVHDRISFSNELLRFDGQPIIMSGMMVVSSREFSMVDGELFISPTLVGQIHDVTFMRMTPTGTFVIISHLDFFEQYSTVWKK